MLSAKELQTVHIEDFPEGHEKIAEIDRELGNLLVKMRRTDEGSKWLELSKERYELKKAKRHIQREMGKLVASRRDARAAVEEDEAIQDGIA